MSLPQFRFHELFVLSPSSTTQGCSPTKNQDVDKSFYVQKEVISHLISVKLQKLLIDTYKLY